MIHKNGRVHGCTKQCLENMIIFGEKNLRRLLKEYEEHYHFERNHQGIENQIVKVNDTLQHSQKGEGEILKKANETTKVKFSS